MPVTGAAAVNAARLVTTTDTAATASRIARGALALNHHALEILKLPSAAGLRSQVLRDTGCNPSARNHRVQPTVDRKSGAQTAAGIAAPQVAPSVSATEGCSSPHRPSRNACAGQYDPPARSDSLLVATAESSIRGSQHGTSGTDWPLAPPSHAEQAPAAQKAAFVDTTRSAVDVRDGGQ